MVEGRTEGRPSNVADLTKERRQRKGHFKNLVAERGAGDKGKKFLILPIDRITFPERDGMAEELPEALTKESVRGVLDGFATVNDEFMSLLNLPERSYHTEDLTSFTSEKGKYVSGVSSHFMLGTPMPEELPEHGLDISSRSSVFCTLVDKKRKIIVFDSINSMHSDGKGSWESFQSSIETALLEVKRKTARGEKFDFVVVNESSVSTL